MYTWISLKPVLVLRVLIGRYDEEQSLVEHDRQGLGLVALAPIAGLTRTSVLRRHLALHEVRRS